MGSTSNPLMTDGYKFSMAQAGFPLREETFYFTCRKGEPLYIPFDLKAVVNEFLPRRLPNGKERAFLATHGYGLTPAMEEALLGRVDIWCPRPGSWVLPGEPILTITGPSFLVSWLEPLVICLNFPLQVATTLQHIQSSGDRKADAMTNWACLRPSCSDELKILRLLEEKVGISRPDNLNYEQTYQKNALQRVSAIRSALKGDTSRAFEVGMRAMTCMQQHELALKACQQVGITKTSNVYLAWKLYMMPVGTTGHEHQMRWSAGNIGEDEPGFRAIRDMRQEPPSYLFDTYDPMEIGLPAAFKVIDETPERPCSLRFDSGDQDAQMGMVSHFFMPRQGAFPNTIFEDGYTAAKTTINEDFCDQKNWPTERRFYGYGGHIVHDPHLNPFGRNRVSAAYKLCQSGGMPVMKFSGSSGKESLPGKPVIMRRVPTDGRKGPVSLVAQQGEEIEGFFDIGSVKSERRFLFLPPFPGQEGWTSSEWTKDLIINLTDMCILKGKRPCPS